MAIPKTLRNFTAFVDGRGYAGKVDEIELPKLTIKTDEYRGGGMDAPVELDVGMEKLEAGITFAEYDPDIFSLFGLTDGNSVGITLRGVRQGDAGIDSVIINVTGIFKELDAGTWKTGETGTLKASLALRYYKLTIAGAALIEIDVENMIRSVGGKDQLAAQRTALGL